MAKQIIDRGLVAGDGTGDTGFVGTGKINDNFTELYQFSELNVPAKFVNIAIDTTTTTTSDIIKMKDGINALPNYIIDGGALFRFTNKRLVLTNGSYGFPRPGGYYAVVTEFYSLTKKIPANGAGVASVGVGGTQLVADDLRYEFSIDNRSLEPTEFNLGDIGANLISASVNTTGPYSTPNGTVIVFTAIQNSVEESWLYLGNQEIIGGGTPVTSETDFKLFTDNDTAPTYQETLPSSFNESRVNAPLNNHEGYFGDMNAASSLSSFVTENHKLGGKATFLITTAGKTAFPVVSSSIVTAQMVLIDSSPFEADELYTLYIECVYIDRTFALADVIQYRFIKRNLVYDAGSVATIPDWVTSTAYAINQEITAISPTTAVRSLYRRTVAGTSGATFDATEEGDWTLIATVGGGTTSDVAYGPTWDANLDAATKNAIYDKIESIVDPELDVLNLGFSGQSGMNCITIGVDGGGDTATNPNVYAWNTITSAWVIADLDLFPFGERFNGGTDISGNNNLAFHIAKRVQEQTGARVNILFDAYSGVPIADWISSGTSSPNWVSFQNMVTASGITKLHGYFWKQGESDNTTAWDLGETYAADLVILRTQVRELFSSLDKVPFVAGELAEKFQLNTKFYSYNNWTKFIDDDNFNVATGKDLATLPDLVHLTGVSVVEQALRYSNAFLSLPKAKDTKESYEEYDAVGDVTYTIPLRTGSEYKFQKIGDSSVYLTKDVGNITFAGAAGVTVLSKNDFTKTNGINSRVRVTKTGINSYLLTGDLQDAGVPNPFNGFYGSDDFLDDNIGALWTEQGTVGIITEANSRLEINLPHTALELWNDLETAIKTTKAVSTGILTVHASIQYQNQTAVSARPVFGMIQNGSEGTATISGIRVFPSSTLAAEAKIQIQVAGANSYVLDTGIICDTLQNFMLLYDVAATRVYLYHWNGATWDELDAATVKTFNILGSGTLDGYYTVFDDTPFASIDFGYSDRFIMHNALYTGLTP